jgi:hypothetical protein
MLRKMPSRYSGRCKKCRRSIRRGEMIFWSKSTGALCDTCGRRDDQSPPIQVGAKPASSSTDTTHDFSIEWSELKALALRAFEGESLGFRPRNEDTFRSNLVNARDWHGFTGEQVQTWLKSGFPTDAIKGLAELSPQIREEHRLMFVEDEGDELHIDLALTGDDAYYSEWTQEESMPGVSLDCIVTFAASTPASVVNAYNVWICRTVYSLESAGIDCEVSLNFQVDNTLDGHRGRTNTRVIVKRENEIADYVSFSPMLSPAAFRGFLFAATAVHAESKGTDASYGLGSGPNELMFGVSYDPDKRRIVATSQRNHAREFPEDRMNQEFRAALLAANNTGQ